MALIRQIVVFLLIIVVSHSDLLAQKSEYIITSAAFYNLENLFLPEKDPNKYDEEFTPDGANAYTYDIYNKKLKNLSRVLSEIAVDLNPDGPALIGVAEVENDVVLKDLIKQPQLIDRKWRIVHFESPDLRGIDVGLLYNPKYFSVLEASSRFVEIKENDRREYTRDILYVRGLLLGDTVNVIVGHWPSRRGGEAASAWKREKAALVCRKIVDSLYALNPNDNIIIMGDLNDDPINNSVSKVLNAKGEKAEAMESGLYNPFFQYYKSGVGTLGYSDSWNLFDQIIVSKSLIDPNTKGLQLYQAHIFNKKYLQNQFGKYKGYPHRSYVGSTWMDGYSDHFPTYIYIVKKK